MTALEKTVSMLKNALENVEKDGYLWMSLGECKGYLFANANYAEINLSPGENFSVVQKLFHDDFK